MEQRMDTEIAQSPENKIKKKEQGSQQGDTGKVEIFLDFSWR